MKKKALAVLLTASVIAGTMGGTATIVHADEEGKVINIYSFNVVTVPSLDVSFTSGYTASRR